MKKRGKLSEDPSKGHKIRLYDWPTQEEIQRADGRPRHYIRPDSVFIAIIGTLYEPTVWAHLADMYWYMKCSGYSCWMEELADYPIQLPYEGLASMRNRAIRLARNFGFQYVLLAETDVLPEPNILERLLQSNMPVTVPFITPKEGSPAVMEPVHQMNTGLGLLRWALLDFVLFRVNSLKGLGAAPFTDCPVEADFWDSLWEYGHSPVMDTTTNLELATYPQGGVAEFDWEKRVERFRAVDKKRGAIPDRSPIDPNDYRVIDGIYVPWFDQLYEMATNKPQGG